MGILIENLKNPFYGLTKNDVNKVQKRCLEIATQLFSNYCIRYDYGTEYYFAEVEFYYWEKGKWEEKWNRVTYPRDGYNAGDLFFHSSGVDICFESSFIQAKFGGILIRAIMDKEGKILVAGPWNCMIFLLNACKNGKLPSLEESNLHNHKANIKSTYRALGEVDREEEKRGPLSLCFYDDIPAEKWIFHKDIYNKEKGCLINSKTYYKTDRFTF